MAGTLHQGILALFQEDPWLAFDILGLARPVAGKPIDRRSEVERDGKGKFTVRAGFPDLVLVHRHARVKRRGIVITVEAQKDFDPDKRWSIPVYQSHLADDHRLGCWAVVVSLDPQMSKALRAWRHGDPPVVDVLLLDIESVPKSWLDDAARNPMAAVLAGALHGYAGDLDAARRAFQFTQTMAGKQRRRHGMTILAALSEDERERLIGELPMQDQHDWMDVERRSGTYHFGVKEGREQGLEQGRRALVEVLFDLLAERGLKVSTRARAKIRKCEDLPTLQRWVRKAVHATSVAELLADR
jgi:hypothetical protein